MSNASLPFAVCVFPERGLNQARSVTYASYIEEILAHAGVFHTTLTLEQLESSLDDHRILLTVGDAELSDAQKSKLTNWVNQGGAWIALAGTCAMDELLGAIRQQPDMWSWGGGL